MRGSGCVEVGEDEMRRGREGAREITVHMMEGSGREIGGTI